MKKIYKAIIAISVAVALMATLTACSFLFGGNNGGSTVCTVSLELDGGTGVSASQFLKNGILTDPKKEPTKAGFDFEGWYFDEEYTQPVEFGKKLESSVVVYARWTERGYVATLILGGSLTETVQAGADGRFSVGIYESKEGYTFDGWYYDAAMKKAADLTGIAKSDIVVYGKWTAIRYSIVYDAGEIGDAPLGAADSYTVEDRIVPAAPSAIKSGYEFLGWFDEDNNQIYSIEKGSTGNIRLIAKFVSHNNYLEIKGGKVSGNTATVGVSNSTSTIKLEDIVTASANATYTVKRGDEDIATTDSIELVEGENEFSVSVVSESGETRIYTLVVTRYDASKATVTYIYPGETEDENVFADKGTTITAPTAQQIAGYTFDGWFGDVNYEEEFDFGVAITGDASIYAKYTPNEYAIKYFVGGWQLLGEATTSYTVEDSVVFPTPTPKSTATERYTFVGWVDADGKDLTGIAKGTIGDIEAYARYSLKGERKNSSFDGTYAPSAEIYSSELDAYFNYCVFERRSVTEFTLFVPESEDGDNYLDTMLNKELNECQSAALAAIEGAQYTYTKEDKTVDGTVYNKYEITLKLEFVTPDKKAADSPRYEQLAFYMHDYVATRESDFEAFAINLVQDTVEVSDADQLLLAVAAGYRPLPTTDSVAERILEKAKSVLRLTVDDAMSDTEKAHAIYDWLVYNVYYDYDLLELSQNSSKTTKELKEYNGFYLEGVFDDGRAVCDGISKAFLLMCGIEGIECVRVTGTTAAGIGHAWNKILISGEWYNVDATSGGLLLSYRESVGGTKYSAEGVTHRYFMLSDEEMAAYNTPDEGVSGRADKEANTEYNIYEKMYFMQDGVEYDYVLTDKADWLAAAEYIETIIENYGRGFAIDFLTTESSKQEVDKKVSEYIGASAGRYVAYFDDASSTLIIWVTE